MQAVVLAGGLATRMRPLTSRLPKALLEVAGRPFVDWQLEKLALAGFSEVILCIAHLGAMLKDHVGDGARFGTSVRYSAEGPTLLGTAGALRAARHLLAPTFLVTYGDSYLPFDYAAPLRSLNLDGASDCDGVMSVFKNEGAWDPSNVITDGTWVLAYEKGTRNPAFDHIDYGAMALRKSVIDLVPDGIASGLDALQRDLAQRRRLRALVVHERFFEIGSPEGLATLDARLRKESYSP
jgi:NDP-sugar pyrophosphorylase family protein